MRVLYLLHRYHTNQNEIMRGWLEHGDEIMFLTQYQGKIEDYTNIKPITLGYSWIFDVWYNFYVNVLRKNDPAAKDVRIRYGLPPLHRIAHYIDEFNPDLIILRERSLYTIFTYLLCNAKHYKTFLYNLSPVWASPEYFKNDIAHKIVRMLTPRYRFTPTHQIGIDMQGKIRDSYSYFAPFLVKPMCAPENRTYFHDGKINIFEIGKYQTRKNHFLMVKVIKRLSEQYPDIRLTIAGEMSDHFHEEYYNQLNNYIIDNHLEEIVTLKKNLSKKQVGDEYLKADIFVVPSTGEPASITVIESMAYSVLSISGTDNGTADYIKPGITGEVFEDGNENDLYNKMDRILSDRNNIPRMGKAGYQSVLDEFQFQNYYNVICKMMKDQAEGK